MIQNLRLVMVGFLITQESSWKTTQNMVIFLEQEHRKKAPGQGISQSIPLDINACTVDLSQDTYPLEIIPWQIKRFLLSI